MSELLVVYGDEREPTPRGVGQRNVAVIGAPDAGATTLIGRAELAQDGRSDIGGGDSTSDVAIEFDTAALMRCPFVRAVADGHIDVARRIAAAPPEPAEPVVIDWLVHEARRHLTTAATPRAGDGARTDAGR
jgi:hypothetical protein